MCSSGVQVGATTPPLLTAADWGIHPSNGNSSLCWAVLLSQLGLLLPSNEEKQNCILFPVKFFGFEI